MRTIKLRLGVAVGEEQHKLVRPITKIVLLVERILTESERTLQNYQVNLGEPDETMTSLLDYQNNLFYLFYLIFI